MLKYPCLVLDHDDTVVQSEKHINYPCFCEFIAQTRPGQTLSFDTYMEYCCGKGFLALCQEVFHYSDAEIEQEGRFWKAYMQTHVPAPYAGMRELLQRQKAAGGYICVVSQSGRENILRDYRLHFGMVPDAVYSWELPPEQRKPNSFALEDMMRRFRLSPRELLVLDDMPPAVEMAHRVGVAIGFAGWGRREYAPIYRKMTEICDFSFETVAMLENFLF